MHISGVTHQYGTWTPVRFLLAPFREKDAPPAFYITTSRMCSGVHDWRCTTAENQTYGPFTMDGVSAEQVWVCPNCHRHQPPADTMSSGDTDEPTCLYCSDMATVHHLGDSRDTTAGLSAVAALHAAAAVLRQVDAETGFVRAHDLLTDTAGALQDALETAEYAVKQDPARARHSLYGALTLIARQITANARKLIPEPREPLPVTETDEGE